MNKYFANLKLGFYRYRQYPLEFFFIVLKRVLQILFMIILWNIVASQNGETDLIELITYFVVFNATGYIIMVQSFNYANSLVKQIHTGALNSVLIKPVNPTLYIYSKIVGIQTPLILVSATALAVLIFNRGLSLASLPFFFLMVYWTVSCAVCGLPIRHHCL